MHLQFKPKGHNNLIDSADHFRKKQIWVDIKQWYFLKMITRPVEWILSEIVAQCTPNLEHQVLRVAFLRWSLEISKTLGNAKLVIPSKINQITDYNANQKIFWMISASYWVFVIVLWFSTPMKSKVPVWGGNTKKLRNKTVFSSATQKVF